MPSNFGAFEVEQKRANFWGKEEGERFELGKKIKQFEKKCIFASWIIGPFYL